MVKTRLVSALVPALCVMATSAAHAGCSRPMNVPMSATGQSVIVADNEITGIYPELLQSLAKEGCEFVLTAVPRARQELMFETGKADLLIPASKTPRRDELGIFIPLIRSRATLISLDAKRPILKSAYELLERKDVRVVLVRGFDYGVAYQELAEALSKQNRLLLESDPVAVARVLKANPGDVTIMAPVIFTGAIQDDARVSDLADRLRLEPLNELPWGESGVYLSRSTLNKEDTATLTAMLTRAAQSGSVWKGFQTYYPANVLKESIRPRDNK